MVQSINDNSPLSGLTVLIVEDDCLMAMDLEATLIGAGARVADICFTLDEAMARGNAEDFAVAILDFSLGSDCVTPFARGLARRGIPFIFHTGASRAEMAEWGQSPIIAKPASSRTLVSALSAITPRQQDRRQHRR
jgi:DNA-binding response OmpR family regulator